MIDVIILGDGFTAASQFAAALHEWLDEHLALKVYDTFAGCLRIRALYTPSLQPASSARGSSTGASRAATEARSPQPV